MMTAKELKAKYNITMQDRLNCMVEEIIKDLEVRIQTQFVTYINVKIDGVMADEVILRLQELDYEVTDRTSAGYIRVELPIE